MKRILSVIAVLLLILMLFIACADDAKTSGSKQSDTSGAAVLSEQERSDVWSLPERYDSKYTTMHYTVSYERSGVLFLLTINRIRKVASAVQSEVRDTKEIDGVVYTLYETKDDQNGTVTGTYYEAHSERFQYRIACESAGYFIEDYLNADDAAALIASPLSPRGDTKLIDTEWDLYLRPEGCNLEIVIFPNDGGGAIHKLDSTFTAREEDGETVYMTESGSDIAYTDGTSSVRICQTKRSGGNSKNYLTLSECKAILALLGINK